MAQPVGMAGLESTELGPIRILVSLLRHPDPAVGELARQALYYVRDTAGKRELPVRNVLDVTG